MYIMRVDRAVYIEFDLCLTNSAVQNLLETFGTEFGLISIVTETLAN